ncbi:MAG TPA: carboxypeptidase regulatory-like domain-containing protein [Candidatus Acidoferrales bacterium]
MNHRFALYHIHSQIAQRSAAALVLLFLAIVTVATTASAGTLNGTVKNGTTGQVAAGADVILIQLQGGMQPVANTKTDAQGHFHFDNPQLGAGPMLVRVVYKGVNYHEPITPGKMSADIEVFEPTSDPKSFNVANHAVILQPNGADLMVGEEYMIANKTQPPLAFYRADGSFDFTLPDGADFNQASAWGASGMPVVQGTIDKGKNKMAIAFPFRPGESGVRLSYKVPYAGNHVTLRNVSPYSSEHLIIAAPPTVQISGAGITAAGQDQGFNVYTRDSVAANAPVEISVSGTAPMPSASQGGGGGPAGAAGAASADDSQNPSVNSRADSASGDAASVSATTIPARLDNLKWILTGGFVSIFVLGFAYLWLRPQPAGTADSAWTTEADVPTPPRAAQRSAARSAQQNANYATAAAAPAAAITPSSPNPSRGAAQTIADVENQVQGSLDDLKNNIFRLELRRQAGTISEEDYTRERARVERALRDLVRG